MAKNEPFYVVNTDKKIITVHKYIKPTEADTEMLKVYIASGYTVREISKRRKTDGTEKITNAKILDAIKDDAEALKKYNELKKINFFTAKSWYLNEYKK